MYEDGRLRLHTFDKTNERSWNKEYFDFIIDDGKYLLYKTEFEECNVED
jgi:hypothetical protein